MMQKFSLVEPNAHAEVKLCWGAAGLSQIFMSMTSKRRTRQNLIDYVAKSNESEKCQRIELAHFLYLEKDRPCHRPFLFKKIRKSISSA